MEKIQQKGEKRKNPKISHLLPYGYQTQLANKHKVSLAYCNAVVNGFRIDPALYTEALDAAEKHQAELIKTEKQNQKAVQRAKKLGLVS